MNSSDPHGRPDRSNDRPPFGVRGESPAGTNGDPSSVPRDPADGIDAAGTADSTGDSGPVGSANPAESAEPTGAPDVTGPTDGADLAEIEQLRERIVDTMKTVYDPEIPVNIYELGMVYEILVEPDRSALVTMTLTSPACPVAGSLPGEVEEKLNEVVGITSGRVELVWDPPWTPERMSEAARLELGMF